LSVGDNSSPACELCSAEGGRRVAGSARLRVVLVDEPDYPGFARVIWNQHVRELTDLEPDERNEVMAVVFAVETAIRATLAPDKVNVASLGNQTPHLHWHVIPRFADDTHFPHSVWAQPQRRSDPVRLAARRALLPQLEQAIAAVCSELQLRS
jgi:diadenosine tetraphosphate (Ap4A) HIT family hydrolase